MTFEVCDAGELCSTATRTVNVLAPGCTLLSQAGFSLVFADSQELIGENGAAVNAFDGDPSTIWHTRWTGTNAGASHELRIDTGATRPLRLSYCTQDGGVNGRSALRVRGEPRRRQDAPCRARLVAITRICPSACRSSRHGGRYIGCARSARSRRALPSLAELEWKALLAASRLAHSCAICDTLRRPVLRALQRARLAI